MRNKEQKGEVKIKKENKEEKKSYCFRVPDFHCIKWSIHRN
jgi:hypothetical protein